MINISTSLPANTSLKQFWVIVVWLSASCSFAQGLAANPDEQQLDSTITKTPFGYRVRPYIISAALISAGSATYAIKGLRQIDYTTRHTVSDMPKSRLEIDDYTQFAPAAFVYGLNVVGIKGKNNFWDRTALFASTQIITAAIVVPSKRIIQRQRPDQTDNFSFPSGHAAVAFASAHFLFKEYRETSFWISISGYPIAAFTSVSRVVESRHWVSDIVAGAGVGILSTELAYLLYPKITQILGKKPKKNIVLIPSFQAKSLGLTFSQRF